MKRRDFFKSFATLIGIAVVAPKELFRNDSLAPFKTEFDYRGIKFDDGTWYNTRIRLRPVKHPPSDVVYLGINFEKINQRYQDICRLKTEPILDERLRKLSKGNS